MPPPKWRQQLRRRLLDWFARHAEDMPWRQTRDPYSIWVSEIMLQQTQVATVVPYYHRFLAALPDIEALASAEEEQVLRLWEGLGYYRRARQLRRAAQVIVAEHDGKFPRDVQQVEALPGIGRYTAGAILSIAFDQRLPILEANTLRLYSRWAGLRADPRRSSGEKFLWRFATTLLPRKEVGAFNQAAMELGRLVCVPKAPDCTQCPVAMLCTARADDAVDVIPLPAQRTQYEDRCEAAVVVRRGQEVLLRRCGTGERWAGLWDFPRFVVGGHSAAAARRELCEQVLRITGLTVEAGEKIITIRHGVTRFRITLHCFEATRVAGRRRSSTELPTAWVRTDGLDDYPLSTTGRRIAQLLIKSIP